MPRLTPIQIDENTIIYIESTDGVEIPKEISTSGGRVAKGTKPEQILQNFQVIENTIRIYTTYTLNSFRNLAIANVNEVTLQFGVEIGAEGGIPYITKGTAKSNRIRSSLLELPFFLLSIHHKMGMATPSWTMPTVRIL